MKNKTYRGTLVLFLLFINIGISVFCILTTKHNFSNIKKSYLREHHFLVSNMTKEIMALQNRNYKVEEAIKFSYDAYSKQYGSQKTYLQVYKDKTCLYSSLPQELGLSNGKIQGEKSRTQIEVRSFEQRKYLRIEGYLPGQYSLYGLVYYVDITDTVKGWQKINTTLFIAGILFSIALSFCLFILIEYLFKPLEKISAASNKIADGKYQEKLEIKGGEEIAEVVQSFNRMAYKIQCQMEALEEHAQEKQRLIDDLAHELRTPLTAIYGYAEYMQKAHLSEEDYYASLDYILSETKRLKNISEHLLELAIVREEKDLEVQAISIEPLLNKICQTEKIKLEEKKIELVYEDELKEIIGNEDLIESMIVNLVDNAIKACPVKGKIRIKTYLEEDKKIIEVEDNGKGMTKDQILHVTEAFYRVDKARSRKEGGNGLGLALCEQIAKKHHATLKFFSIPRKQTSVKIVFTDKAQ